MIKAPSYVDGYFDLFKLQQDEESDFPQERLVDQSMRIWFNEISVYDRLRFELSQGGKEITMKIRIPQYRGIDSQCVCKINGVFHEVYNAAHITSREGFQETELTLVAPEKNMEDLEHD